MFWFLFLIFFVACLAAGATGGLFPPGAWYRALNKPSWTPPDWLFPIAWLILYFCISFAGARIAMAPENGIALAFWALQISVNGLWTPVFFGVQNIRLGMFVVIALWLVVLGCIVVMWPVDTLAAVLFIPYLIWATIAAALNAAVWQMNPKEAQGAS